MSPHPVRRVVLRALVGAGTLAGIGACGGEPTTPATTPPPAPATSSGSPTRTPGTPTVPEGLDASQRSAYPYGEHPRQVSDLWLPGEGTERRPGVVVVVHGGGWGPVADRSETDALVADLVGRGHAVLNVDYRGVGDGGGWTGTFTDVAAAVDVLAGAAAEHGLDAARSVIVGHSAGGHLAVWAAARHRLPAGAPGASPAVRPIAAASLAGVLHPSLLADPQTGDPNVTKFFGGTTAEVPDRYAAGDPTNLLPLGIPLLAVHGTDDDVVPPAQADSFTEAARAAGDDVRQEEVPGEGHGTPLFPSSRMWELTRAWLQERLG
ncbi:hypothetical protein NUM3379_32400 [Kineococcus sp. NUM-3379]